jgi:hypothetical protein
LSFILCAHFAAEVLDGRDDFFVDGFHFGFGEGAVVGADYYFEGERFFAFRDV